MEKMFCLGLIVGAVGGMLIVANSYKARALVKKSQDELKQKVEKAMDEKLQEFDKNSSQSQQNESQNTASQN